MQSVITFLRGHQPVTIEPKGDSRFTPTTTVLQYLRNLPSYKGTKEGCAEGDCGACTVVIGELTPEGTIRYKSVDSCLVFLPMLQGKQLITVEDLEDPEGELHPVQQAMVDDHGSQCGYCTPGFIMSLFSLYKNRVNPSREQIEDALTGNLCRCTGYRPIVRAAADACAQRGCDSFIESESSIVQQLRSIPGTSLHLQTNRQQYFKPASLGETITLIHRNPDAIIISGATDIALRVTKKHELLKSIIDITDIRELKQYTENHTTITLGAGLCLNEVMNHVQPHFPALHSMLSVFGSHQIRNLATLGGNIGTASPIGDTLPVLIAYNASVSLESINGRRTMPLESFILGYRKTARKIDELITSIIIPKISNGAIVKSYKVSKRRDLDISTLSGGFRLELNGENNVKNIKLAYGGMAAYTKRAKETEQFLTGKEWNRATVEQAMEIIEKEFTPISDARSGSEFRRIVARNLLLKFWSEVQG